MINKQVNLYDVPFPSADVWRVYSTIELPLLFKKMPEAVESIDIIGDGGVGTFFDQTLPPGGPFRRYKEKVVRADDELRVKEVAVVEGGYLGIGYVFFRTLFYIIEKSPELTTVRSVIIYEINDKDAANEKYASAAALEGVAKAVEKYLGELKSAKKNVFNKQVNEYDMPFPAADVWRVYSSMELPLLFKKMKDVVEDIQIIGDGGLGSFFINTLPPGGPFKQYKEKVVRTDNEMRVKEVAVVEGGYLDIGYVFFRTIFSIIKKSHNVTTVRSVILYEINANAAANEKYAGTAAQESAAKAVEKYLRGKHNHGKHNSTNESAVH